MAGVAGEINIVTGPKDVHARGDRGDELRVGNVGQIGNLLYRVISSKGWVNVQSEDGLCARVHIREHKISSEDVTIEILADGEIKCDEWGLRVLWLSTTKIQFVLDKSSCEIEIEDA